MNKVSLKNDLILIAFAFLVIVIIHAIVGCAPEYKQYIRVNQDTYVTTPAGEVICPQPKEDDDQPHTGK